MATENETVAEIVKRVRRDCNSYPLPTAAAEMLKLVREIEAAHKREVDELNFKLLTAKSEQKTAANVIIEQTNKIEELQLEVEELQECLKEAIGCADEFQKFFEEHPYLCKYTRDVVKKSRKALEGANDDNA